MVAPWQEFPEFFGDPTEMIAAADFYSRPMPGTADDFAEFHRHWTARECGDPPRVMYEIRRARFQKAPKS